MKKLTCVVCGRPFESVVSAATCSLNCKRFRCIKSKITSPPPQPIIHNIDYDPSLIFQSHDNSVQVKLFSNILSELNISHTLNHQLGEYNYDIKLDDKPVLICADTTATSNEYTLASEKMLQRNRTLLAWIHGYRCIHIYDWDDYLKILSSLIPKHHVSAHRCKIAELDNTSADMFYHMYHLGELYSMKDPVHLGLFLDDMLVQCMTFAKSSRAYEYTLCRFCSDFEYIIDGGASKLFQYFIKLKDPESIVAYCDCDKFTGDVFEKIGMKLSCSNEPNRIWSKGIERVHGGFLSLSELHKLLGAVELAGKSNAQILLEHGWVSVYNCGKSRYTWFKNAK